MKRGDGKKERAARREDSESKKKKLSRQEGALSEKEENGKISMVVRSGRGLRFSLFWYIYSVMCV